MTNSLGAGFNVAILFRLEFVFSAIKTNIQVICLPLGSIHKPSRPSNMDIIKLYIVKWSAFFMGEGVLKTVYTLFVDTHLRKSTTHAKFS